MKRSTTHNHNETLGFTLLELLVVVTILGILAAGAIFGVVSNRSKTSQSKLETQVAQLNTAVSTYKASGGNLNNLIHIDSVLAKLKSTASANMKGRIVGNSGSLIDLGLVASYQSDMEAVSSDPRAIWDSESQRFEIRTSGFNGARWFTTDATVAANARLEDDRKTPLLYAATSTWVWDYTDFASAPNNGPNSNGGISVTPPVAGATGSTPVQLNPPYFTVPGGDFDYSLFNMTVYINNDRNLEGTSDVFYTTGDNYWHTYTGEAITVTPNMTLSAYAGSKEHSKWYDSLRTDETYKSKFIINGDVDGEFSNAIGGTNMVTGGNDNHFTWGNSAIASQDPSWMLFNGNPFTNVSNDSRFKLGDLTYYNGTIQSGTGSEFVDIGISLTFAGTSAPIDFNFTLELINSINVAGDEVASADYVKLDNITSDFALSLGGVDYKLKLEFGETTENGFSNLEEFFVYENSAASGVLYGTLVPVIIETPLAMGNAYGLNGGNSIGNAYGLNN